jgi:hypothetical protein
VTKCILKGKPAGTLPCRSPLSCLASGSSFPGCSGVHPGRGDVLGGAGISPTGQPALFVCLSVHLAGRQEVVGAADRQAGAQLQPPSCLGPDCSISASFACISA